MNETSSEGVVPSAPVERRIENVFVPVKDVNRSREWYRDVLGLPVGEVLFA